MDAPLCSIIILSYNQLDYTKQCLESIAQYTQDVSYEVIVIDNGSAYETISYLAGIPGIRFVSNQENKGFAGGCNQGISLARGKYIMLLNNDTIVTEHWLFHMVQLLEQRPDISMTGPLTNATVGKQKIEVPYAPDDMAAMHAFAKKVSSSDAKPWRTLRLVAFCLLARRELFDEIGLFDTGFKVGNYEDDDFNIRALRAGKKAYICRQSFIHHFMNVSFRQKDVRREEIMQANKLYLEKKWDQMDWNHHAVHNRYMLERILELGGGRLLHIGCGLGALEIEIKDSGQEWHLAGMEGHPVRESIAAGFLDEMYPYSIEALRGINQKFDVIVVECTLERWGATLLREVKERLEDGGLVLIRVFNANHITTIEKAVTGAVGGGLLCAASKDFQHYYDGSLEEMIEGMGYQVMETKEIRKSLSSLQEELITAVKSYLSDENDARVYNRIYKVCVR